LLQASKKKLDNLLQIDFRYDQVYAEQTRALADKWMGVSFNQLKKKSRILTLNLIVCCFVFNRLMLKQFLILKCTPTLSYSKRLISWRNSSRMVPQYV